MEEKMMNDKFVCVIYGRSLTVRFYEEEKPDCMGEIGCYNCCFCRKPDEIREI